MSGVTITDEYGNDVTLAGVSDETNLLSLLVTNLVAGTSYFTFTDPYGDDHRIALSDLSDGRKALLVNLLGTVDGGGGTGVDGKSAYELAVENGFVGTVVEWLASLVGPMGPSGSSEDPGDLVNAFNANLT